MKRAAGFTLIEILIALAVFSILATMTSSAIYEAFNTRARVTLQADRLSSLQLAIAIFNQDTQQIVARTVRGKKMHIAAAFIGQRHYLEFTRGGHANPQGLERRSTLTRVAFLCQGSQLIRRHWDTLDGPSHQAFQDKILLEHLSQCQFAYLNKHQQILPDWMGDALQENQKESMLPAAIQFTAHVAPWGKLSLLFMIPGAMNEE